MTAFSASHRGGAGEPLLLLHGFTDTWRTWELVLPALERRHDVLAPTLPGHAGGPPLGDLADAVEAAMDDAGWETAHVAGNSLGGYVALRLAQRGRARTVVALAPAGGWAPDDASWREVLTYFAGMQEQVRQIAPHAAAVATSADGRRAATRMISERFEHLEPALVEHLIVGAARCDGAGALLDQAAREGWPLNPSARRLPVAHRVGRRGPGAALAWRRRRLPGRVPDRRLGRARRRRPLPAARRPAGDRAADPRAHVAARHLTARVRTIRRPMRNAERMLEHAASNAAANAAPNLSAAPGRKVAVLSCMDARIAIFPLLGLKRGDAHIVRNAGGLATDDAIRSLAISQRVLGTEEVIVVMHDGCGLHGASEDDFTTQLADDGAHPSWRMGAFAEVEATLRNSLQRLRTAPELIHHDHIRGFVFDPETGALREVG